MRQKLLHHATICFFKAPQIASSRTCQDCGDSRGGNLVAHHIKAFASYPDLRFEVSNGLTLCKSCHAKRHEKGQDNGERHKDLLG